MGGLLLGLFRSTSWAIPTWAAFGPLQFCLCRRLWVTRGAGLLPDLISFSVRIIWHANFGGAVIIR